MASNPSAADQVLHALGYALFRREESGALRIEGPAPDWLAKLWPEIAAGQDSLDSGVSPFVDNFLIDAEECWRVGGRERARSGPWVEQDARGESVQLEATTLTIDAQPVLLLERLGEVFEAKKSLLQKARETVIAYQRLNSEIQKKEILLHCVAEDMTAALANIVTSLRLLELENNSPKSRLLLGLASRATEEQRALIHKVLAVFAEELNGIFAQNGEAGPSADLRVAAQLAIEATAAQANERNVRLIAPALSEAALPVALEPGHLERVVSNLIENALEHVAAGGEIAIAIEQETDAALLLVDDNGAAMPPDACEDLFSKPEPLGGLAQAPLLRLHFCRMIVESCGGEIGCSPRTDGGNRFWIRLPKKTS